LPMIASKFPAVTTLQFCSVQSPAVRPIRRLSATGTTVAATSCRSSPVVAHRETELARFLPPCSSLSRTQFGFRLSHPPYQQCAGSASGILQRPQRAVDSAGATSRRTCITFKDIVLMGLVSARVRPQVYRPMCQSLQLVYRSNHL
jgi:hypothetical protein